MTSLNEAGQQVAQRATGRCEYCKMHQSLQGATFHVEHVIPRSFGGRSELANLGTVDALGFNHERRIMIRQAEALFRLFPPIDA